MRSVLYYSGNGRNYSVVVSFVSCTTKTLNAACIVVTAQEAEKSLAKLKEQLKTKEQELETANHRLEETRGQLETKEQVQVRTPDNQDVMYENMMRDRDEQIDTLNELLVSCPNYW
jgi:chromosome segregation ATPase